MDGEFVFDFEKDLVPQEHEVQVVPEMPVGDIGQQPRNFVRNFRKTVCAFWVKGMCMKGDSCGFLHKWELDKMPPCHTMLKKGSCPDPDCPFKHTMEDIKECNMYALGFCIFGPECRYKHSRLKGPPPDPSTVEAAKPKQFRDINRVVNTVNENVTGNEQPAKRPKTMHQPPFKAIMPGPRPPPTAPPPLQGSMPPSSAPSARPPPGPRPPSGPVPPARPPPAGPSGMMPPPFAPAGPRPPQMGPPRGMLPSPMNLPAPFIGGPGPRPHGMSGPLPSPLHAPFPRPGYGMPQHFG